MADRTPTWLADEEQRRLFADRIADGAQRAVVTRREFLTALGLGSTSLLLAACGAAPPAAPTPASPAAPTAGPAAAAGNPLPDDKQVFRVTAHDFVSSFTR
ncbi:MAG: hypothetical protein HGA45_14210 [Chloroflexales bacterium]|nr:hypothetical protein [Chloroflexales bacterium]